MSAELEMMNEENGKLRREIATWKSEVERLKGLIGLKDTTITFNQTTILTLQSRLKALEGQELYEARFKRLVAMEASLAPEDRIAYYVRNPHELDRLIKLDGLAKNVS